MTHAPAIFDRHAPGYDAERRCLIPPYDAFYGAAIAALALAGRPLRRVLDLGAGTGLLSRAVARAHPEAQLTLLDGAAGMLDVARASSLGDGATYVTADFADAPPPGPWDAVVSALAIHHLDDAGKRALYARVHAQLAPGGVFVNAEQVSGPTARLDAEYAAWHERSARALGATDEQWAAARERMGADHLAPLDDQLRWLRDAGFDDVDCLFKDHGFAVLVARRGEPG
jgi:tRNA (cmo5U34)-methyltransferase